MSLSRLKVAGVRCLHSVDIELDPERSYLFGPNGAGKTSLLEGVFLLGRGRSFRTRQTARVVERQSKALNVYGELVGQDGPQRLGVRFEDGRLECRVDGDRLVGLADLARAFPVHVIDPRLHQLIEAGPSERRRFLDAGVFHVEPGFLADWRHFRRLLAQRNAVLKTGAAGRELAIWSEPLLAAGEAVHRARAGYLKGLTESVRAMGNRLIGSDIELIYRCGWRIDDSLAVALADSEERDRQTGFTQVGPHRADFRIRFEIGEVRDAASRGQQKLVAAALVLGQVGELSRRTGRSGLLLVDDPAAELDSRSLERLLAEIDSLDAQLLLTGLAQEALVPKPGARVFHVEQGEINRVL
jgi:DNA replication and repair protein RecF